MRCGFIGLGHIGKFLAGSLVRNGFEVTVFDLNEEAGKPLVAKGAKWATSIKELCDASDTVFTCLPSPRAIDAVVAGPGGVLESLAGRATPATWVDMSTNDQSETLRLGEIAKSKGVQILESPVTGGVHKAAHGDITVLVGGAQGSACCNG
jgi:3-hydroxyisobutyrate dehydrogenase